MTKKVYVGNLPFKTTEEDLSGLFSQVGPVESVSIITDRDTGRSKGFGFVSMGAEDADKAIAQFNGQDFNGRALTVNEARPMVKKEGFSGGRGNYR
jgi:RNA recognition motif-containing protein